MVWIITPKALGRGDRTLIQESGSGQPFDGFEAFSGFCRTRGVEVLPAPTHTVREFARDLLPRGRSSKDIVASVRAVHAAHVSASLESPTRDPDARPLPERVGQKVYGHGPSLVFDDSPSC